MISSPKTALRKIMKQRMMALSASSILEQSHQICSSLFDLIDLNTPQPLNISIFLSMPHEVSTRPILAELFALNERRGSIAAHRLFVPKVLSPSDRESMVMIPIPSSMEELDAFPKNKWGIPEPDVPLVQENEVELDFDLVLVPGFSFFSSSFKI